MTGLNNSEILVRIQNGMAVASMPRFGLYAKAESVQAALEALEKKKNELKAELSDAEMAVHFPPLASREQETTRARTSELGNIALKFGIAGAIIACTVYVSAAIAASQFKRAIGDNAISGRQFWAQIEKSLDASAKSENNLSEEKKQKLLSDVRTIVQRWKPFVHEAMQIFPQPPKL
jgi:hypothetical protein